MKASACGCMCVVCGCMCVLCVGACVCVCVCVCDQLIEGHVAAVYVAIAVVGHDSNILISLHSSSGYC